MESLRHTFASLVKMIPLAREKETHTHSRMTLGEIYRAIHFSRGRRRDESVAAARIRKASSFDGRTLSIFVTRRQFAGFTDSCQDLVFFVEPSLVRFTAYTNRRWYLY